MTGRDEKAARLADELKPGEAGTSTNKFDRKLSKLGSIAAAYRVSAEPGDQTRQCQFKWRHLEVEDEIARGAFGIVYKAWDSTLQTWVALKLAKGEIDFEIRERLLVAEAQRMARLRHPSVLAVHGAGVDEGRVGIWSDLLRGRTLAKTIKEEGPLSSLAVANIANDLTDALMLIHRKAIVHGDIKPANIMLSRDGTPVLMDFGAVQGALTSDSAYGTPLAMAPERFEGAGPSPTQDIYALGVVLFYSLTGRYPHSANELAELEKIHRDGASIDYKEIPRPWRKLLRKMLATRPEQRIEATQIATELEGMKTARARLRTRIGVSAIIVSLAVAATAATLAYRAAEQSRDRTDRVKGLIVDAVEGLLPTQQSEPASILSLYQSLEETIEEKLSDYPSALAEMRLLVGKGLGQLSESERGLELAKSGLSLMKSLPATSNENLVNAYLTQASLERNHGNDDAAEQAIRDALTVLDQSTEEFVEKSRLVVLNRLAMQQARRGNWHGSVESDRQLLQQRLTVHPDEPVRAAVDYHNLGTALNVIGRYREALESQLQAAELLRNAGDEQSLRMGYVKHGIAFNYVELGRFEEAAEMLEQAQALVDASLPPDHSRHTLLALTRSKLLESSGNPGAAIEILQTEVKDRASDDNIKHQLHGVLADALIEAQRWQEAITTLENLLSREIDAVSQHNVAHYRAALAYALYRSGATPTTPIAVIDEALAELTQAGFGDINRIGRLQSWRRTLAVEKPQNTEATP